MNVSVTMIRNLDGPSKKVYPSSHTPAYEKSNPPKLMVATNGRAALHHLSPVMTLG